MVLECFAYAYSNFTLCGLLTVLQLCFVSKITHYCESQKIRFMFLQMRIYQLNKVAFLQSVANILRSYAMGTGDRYPVSQFW
jgi:hypothetical protein